MLQTESVKPVVDSGYVKKELPKSIGTVGIILLIIGVVTGVLSYFINPARASFSYLASFIFLVCICTGSLFVVALEYAAGAVWSVAFRRISEFFSASIPFLIILAIPLFFSLHNLYIWTNPAAVAHDAVLRQRTTYLNIPFFIVRDIIILAVWSLFYFVIIKNSRKQDFSFDQNLTTKNIKVSIAFMVVYAFTVSVFSFDWLMSMTPHWFSTIFGVYVFADSAWVGLAITTLAAVTLTERGYLTPKINRDHYYSLGTLMFAFTVFWAYIAFSQYMLQWYGNLPEEIVYYIHRWTGIWKPLSLALVISHFFVPFLLLLPKSSKTNPNILRATAIWIILTQFLDSYWLVMPGMVNNGFTFHISWMDFTFPLAAIGLVVYLFSVLAKKHNLMPIGDPKLKRTFDFHLN